MSYDSWTCVAVTKGPGVIPENAKRAFKMAACRLHKERRDQMLFATDECSGLIKTKWETQTLGMRTGVFFSVEVETEDGLWQVNFLLHNTHLEEGASRLGDPTFSDNDTWNDTRHRFPVDQLYEFEDLRPRRFN